MELVFRYGISVYIWNLDMELVFIYENLISVWIWNSCLGMGLVFRYGVSV